jgi:hypothetical protein
MYEACHFGGITGRPYGSPAQTGEPQPGAKWLGTIHVLPDFAVIAAGTI